VFTVGLASRQFTIGIAVLLGVLLRIIVSLTCWTLLHSTLDVPGLDSASQPVDGPEVPGRLAPLRVRAIAAELSRLPRWVLPLGGASLLVLVYIITGLGVPMAALTFAALLLGLTLHDGGEEDRRADMPVAVAGTWLVLFAVVTGLLLPIIAGLSVIAFVVGSILVLLRDYPLRLIPAGLVALFLVEIALSAAHWLL
jgi:hypothetical protein